LHITVAQNLKKNYNRSTLKPEYITASVQNVLLHPHRAEVSYAIRRYQSDTA